MLYSGLFPLPAYSAAGLILKQKKSPHYQKQPAPQKCSIIGYYWRVPRPPHDHLAPNDLIVLVVLCLRCSRACSKCADADSEAKMKWQMVPPDGSVGRASQHFSQSFMHHLAAKIYILTLRCCMQKLRASTISAMSCPSAQSEYFVPPIHKMKQQVECSLAKVEKVEIPMIVILWFKFVLHCSSKPTPPSNVLHPCDVSCWCYQGSCLISSNISKLIVCYVIPCYTVT